MRLFNTMIFFLEKCLKECLLLLPQVLKKADRQKSICLQYAAAVQWLILSVYIPKADTEIDDNTAIAESVMNLEKEFDAELWSLGPILSTSSQAEPYLTHLAQCILGAGTFDPNAFLVFSYRSLCFVCAHSLYNAGLRFLAQLVSDMEVVQWEARQACLARSALGKIETIKRRREPGLCCFDLPLNALETHDPINPSLEFRKGELHFVILRLSIRYKLCSPNFQP
ncbi:hypothetical protein MRB53_016179 [Persea americana]|uniref:Uncharacterized protein n=1 Tax=Persea americana TaxID=3435 RepID=A0ACC2M1G5_PERAE|nr:hypothetical protein MRB53_016179 [Persea americana]